MLGCASIAGLFSAKNGRREKEKLFSVVERASLPSSFFNVHDLCAMNQ